MDNFKKMKMSGNNRSRAVDGILPTQKVGKKGHLNLKKSKSYLPQSDDELGKFGRKEGFHPYKQSQLGPRQPNIEPIASLPGSTEEVVELDNNPKKKSRRFFKKRDKDNKKSKSWKKRLLWGSLLVFLLTAIIGGYLFAKGYINLRKVFKGGSSGAPSLQKNVDPIKLKGEGDGRVNVLLLGRGGDGHEAPDLTDTLLVASIDPIQKEAALLSIPRDLWVKTNVGSTKINSVFALTKNKAMYGKKATPENLKIAEDAGLKAIEETVASTMGIPIHYRVMVDFKAFREAIDTVGGIDVNVTEPLRDTLWLEDTGKVYTIDVKPGVQHMDGRKALVYSRSRHTSTRGDFDRTERQRGVIIALKEKVFSVGTFSNPVKISQLISTFGNHVNANMSVNEILRMYDISKEIGSTKVASVGLADPPNNFVTTGNINGQSVVVPRAGTFVYTEIQNYVRNTLKDGYIRSENPSVMVLNGTNTPGLATTKANILKSYGYNVTQVTDAPSKNYTKTVLVDLRNGTKKYTKRYLEKRFNTTAVSTLPDAGITPGTADFVIILGQNESTTN